MRDGGSQSCAHMIVRSCGEWRVSLRSGVACLIYISIHLSDRGEGRRKGKRSAVGVLEADVTAGELVRMAPPRTGFRRSSRRELSAPRSGILHGSGWTPSPVGHCVQSLCLRPEDNSASSNRTQLPAMAGRMVSHGWSYRNEPADHDRTRNRVVLAGTRYPSPPANAQASTGTRCIRDQWNGIHAKGAAGECGRNANHITLAGSLEPLLHSTLRSDIISPS